MFITFEGIDFCGKSTQVALLKDYLEAKGKQTLIIREPGGTAISEAIRSILLNTEYEEMVQEAEMLLFSAARAQLVREKISHFLQKDYFVISDRFHDSTAAYQGYGRGLPLEIIEPVSKLAIGETTPDVTFFLDITVEESLKRKAAYTDAAPDRIEQSKEDFYRRVRDGYLELSRKEQRFVTIDGALSIEQIHEVITSAIETRIVL